MMDAMDPNMAQAPGEMPEGGEESESPGGFRVCIDVTADGQMSVYSAPLPPEGPQGEPVKDAAEAFKRAYSIIEQDGEMGPTEADQQGSFQEGFQGVRG